jgi:hypothetical protein
MALVLVISTHSRKLFNDKLKELTNGVHIISFGGKTKPQTRMLMILAPQQLTRGFVPLARYSISSLCSWMNILVVVLES